MAITTTEPTDPSSKGYYDKNPDKNSGKGGFLGIDIGGWLRNSSKRRHDAKKRKEADYKSAVKQVGATDLASIEKEIGTISAPDFSKLIAARQAGLGGYNAPESEAMRSQMALAQQGQDAQQRRQLLAAQAKAGVRGGAMAAQAARQAQLQGAQRAAGEQQLFVQNIAEQQRRAKEYEDLQKNEMLAQQAQQLAMKQLAAQEMAQRKAALANLFAAKRLGQ